MRKKQTAAEKAHQKERERLFAAANKALGCAVKQDSRLCFGIAYFRDEAMADAAGAAVRAAGYTYNGGYFHGMPCGRDKDHDHVDPDTGRKLYAVTR